MGVCNAQTPVITGGIAFLHSANARRFTKMASPPQWRIVADDRIAKLTILKSTREMNEVVQL
jgi:hypothetical protein